MTTSIDLTDRAHFPFWYSEKVRFSDTDMLGHVNNVAFAALIESGRVAYIRDSVLAHLPSNLLVVMARLEIDYRRELHFPAEIAIGSQLVRLGRTSLTIASGLFHGELCAATASTTLVLIDYHTRRPIPFPDQARAALEAHLPA